MQFLILNRDRVKNYVTDKKHILIQAYCHNDYPEEPSKLWTRLGVLQLQFDDWDAEQKTLIEKEYPHSERAKHMIYFSEQHAKKLIRFVKKHLDKIELIVVQCDAGISRSTGIAAALSKCVNDDDECFFKQYLPNSLVYSTILKEWDKNFH